MKQLHLTIFSILLFCTSVFSQDFVWIQPDTNHTVATNNTSELPVLATQDGGLLDVQPESDLLSYDQFAFGAWRLEKRNAQGILQWQYVMSDSVSVRDLAEDDSGRVYVGGIFMNRFISAGHLPTLNTQPSDYGINMFLLRINVDGSFDWIRNLSLGLSGLGNERLDALAIDAQNRCWYGYNTYQQIRIRRINDLGNDVQSYVYDEGLLLGDMEFDAQGNLFVSGAVGIGSMTVNNTVYTAPHTYNHFISKISSTGISEWVNFYADITFQYPALDVDNDGNVYFSVALFEESSYGTTVLIPSSFGGDFALVKLTSSGTVLWAKDIPEQSGFGDFLLLNRKSLSIDNVGQIWLAGTFRGDLDFGTGLFMTTGNIQNNNPLFLRYDTDGILNRALQGGGNSFDLASGISVSANGDLYFSALVRDTISFGSLSDTLPSDYCPLIGKWSENPFASIFSSANTDTIKLFPNPSTGILKINSIHTPDRIRIMDLQGRFIREMSGDNSFDVSDLPAAMYLVQVFQKEQLTVSRWIKNH